MLPPDAGDAAAAVKSPLHLFYQLSALAEKQDWAGLLALASALPDRLIGPRSVLFLAEAAYQMGDATALRRALRLGCAPDFPAATRIGLVRRLMEWEPGPEGALRAWSVFSTDFTMLDSDQAEGAARRLAFLRLRLRLPPGPEREMAAWLLSHYAHRFPEVAAMEDRAVQDQLRALAREADWAGYCRMALAQPDRRLGGGTAGTLLAAALDVGDDAALGRALSLLCATPPAAEPRVALARRLAVAGRVPEAWALLGAPGLSDLQESGRPGLMLCLLTMLRHASGPLRAEIQGLLASISAPALPLRERRPFLPWPGSARRVMGGSFTIQAGASVSESQKAAFLALRAEHDRSLAEALAGTSMPFRRPELELYDDVIVDETGRVRDDAGRVAPILHHPAPLGLPLPAPDAPRFEEAGVAADIAQNFFHWYVERLPALAWRLRPGAPRVPLLVSARAPAFLRQTLELLTDDAPELVAVQQPVRVGRAYATARGFMSLFHWDCLGGLYEGLLARALARTAPAPSRRWLYLSRRDAPSRRLGNEAALEEALQGLGFHVMAFGGLPLAEQLRAFHEAEIVVAPHGAGLSHMLTARPGLRIFEIMPALPGTETLRLCFARLSDLCGHRHALWLERVHPLTGAWEVELPAMLEALRRFMDEAPRR